MAHALDLRVVAEGVESAAVTAEVVAMGVDLLQGYHQSPPDAGRPGRGLGAAVERALGHLTADRLGPERLARYVGFVSRGVAEAWRD